MLHLADTSIRLYRKRNGAVSVRWHSYLMINAKGQGFRLAAYLNQFNCSVTFATGQNIILDDHGYTDDCIYEMDHMAHEVWASGITDMGVIEDTVALLRLEYRLFSYPGQGDQSVIECVSPVLARRVRTQQYSSNASKWV